MSILSYYWHLMCIIFFLAGSAGERGQSAGHLQQRKDPGWLAAALRFGRRSL